MDVPLARSPRTRVATALLALMFALALLVSAPPASAHTSSYCGHGSQQEFADGALWLVEFWSQENALNDGRQVHYHYYIHHVYNGMWGWVAVHSHMKHCGGWH